MLVKENEKIYWFKNEVTGSEIQPPQAMDLFVSIVGRTLTPFETGLVLSKPINGSININPVSMLMADPDAPPGAFLNAIRLVVGYFVRHRENASRFAYGDVIGTDIFCDIDGNILRRVSETCKSEPGLETPWIDPIDLLGALPADLAKLGAKSFFRAIASLLEKDAAVDLAEMAGKRTGKFFEVLSSEDLKEIWGGMPARPGFEPKIRADQLDKPIKNRLGVPTRVLEGEERKGVIAVVGALERVSRTSASTAEEIMLAVQREVGDRRVKDLLGKLKGWTEVDVLKGNPGGSNTMRVLYKVKNDEWSVRLLDMHGGGFSM